MLQKRQADNAFADVWTTEVDPASRFVNRGAARQHAGQRLDACSRTARRREKVDLLVIGEGYTAAEMPKFHARREAAASPALFAQEPFKSRRGDFNVRALDLPSAESGVNRPNAGVFRRTPLSAEYNIFDSERYVLTLDNRALRDAASAAPYEFIEILVNERDLRRRRHLQRSGDRVGRQRVFAEYVFVHEFGHHFAALADEYYTSDVAYETGAAPKPEPWEPNVTALHDPAQLKWRDLVTPGTPLPTPWDKEEFEKHTAGDPGSAGARSARATRPKPRWTRSSASSRRSRTEVPGRDERTRQRVGAFEGAAYEARGLYRPQADCIMFTRDRGGFLRGVPAGDQRGSSTCTRNDCGAASKARSADDGSTRRSNASASARMRDERKGDGDAAEGQAGRGDHM